MDRMRYIYSVAVFLLAVTAAAFPAPPQLPSDPAVTYGTLPNGLTYYIVTLSGGGERMLEVIRSIRMRCSGQGRLSL